MEDLNDNLPTNGKRYYMSHTEYFYSKVKEEEVKKLNSKFNFSEPMMLHQLVCASNVESARKAVTNQLEKNKEFIVTKCRIDFLIVGD